MLQRLKYFALGRTAGVQITQCDREVIVRPHKSQQKHPLDDRICWDFTKDGKHIAEVQFIPHTGIVAFVTASDSLDGTEWRANAGVPQLRIDRCKDVLQMVAKEIKETQPAITHITETLCCCPEAWEKLGATEIFGCPGDVRRDFSLKI